MNQKNPYFEQFHSYQVSIPTLLQPFKTNLVFSYFDPELNIATK